MSIESPMTPALPVVPRAVLRTRAPRRRTGDRRPALEVVQPPQPEVAFDIEAAVELGAWLRSVGYRFTTVTPESHRRVNARPGTEWSQSLRDMFGWSRPFTDVALPLCLLDRLERGHVIRRGPGDVLSSRLRFSTLGDLLCAHSAFPTTAPDAVFFGPDTYRFAALIRRALAADRHAHVERLVDVGCGSGAGGLLAAQLLADQRPRVVLADINPAALRCAQVSAILAGVPEVRTVESDLLRNVAGDLDLVLCNPPYLVDAAARTYRHGGHTYGAEFALRVVVESLPRLAPGGRLVLYTGAAVVEGVDQFRKAVEPLLRDAGVRFEYEELDPDVFGEELDGPAYGDVERIAAVGLIARRPGGHS
ncbi:MAG TPA: class I SAM-dependent methyltransferase [Nevskiaceae bacterium]|nr:class I SAM-dependent methyltransferase [Nevskiaceae bacterium]